MADRDDVILEDYIMTEAGESPFAGEQMLPSDFWEQHFFVRDLAKKKTRLVKNISR